MKKWYPQQGNTIVYVPVANCPYIGVAASDPRITPDGHEVITITLSVAVADVEAWPRISTPRVVPAAKK